jgi:clan AA aspartic protease
MGVFSVPIEVAGLEGRDFIAVTAMVDTGSTYTMLPEEISSRLGIRPLEKVSFELADNRVAQYDVGHALVRLDGRERIVLMVFGEEGTVPLLGATTLQLFNLAVDATRERLLQARAFL